jgi:hypothetical protein
VNNIEIVDDAKLKPSHKPFIPKSKKNPNKIADGIPIIK